MHIQGRLVANPNYICPRYCGKAHPIDGRTVTQVDVHVDGSLFDVEASFCYLGDMHTVELRWWLLTCHYNQVLYCLGKVQEASANPDIQAYIPHSLWEGV